MALSEVTQDFQGFASHDPRGPRAAAGAPAAPRVQLPSAPELLAVAGLRVDVAC